MAPILITWGSGWIALYPEEFFPTDVLRLRKILRLAQQDIRAAEIRASMASCLTELVAEAQEEFAQTETALARAHKAERSKVREQQKRRADRLRRLKKNLEVVLE